MKEWSQRPPLCMLSVLPKAGDAAAGGLCNAYTLGRGGCFTSSFMTARDTSNVNIKWNLYCSPGTPAQICAVMFLSYHVLLFIVCVCDCRNRIRLSTFSPCIELFAAKPPFLQYTCIPASPGSAETCTSLRVISSSAQSCSSDVPTG